MLLRKEGGSHVRLVVRRIYFLGTQPSFTLPQVDVDDATDQGEWESHPGQGEAVTEATARRVPLQDLLSMESVDQCPREHSCTCGPDSSVRLGVQGGCTAPGPQQNPGTGTNCCRGMLGTLFHCWSPTDHL